MNGDCGELTTGGSIQSGSAVSAVLGRATSRVVRPSRGTVYLGRHQQREDQVLLCDLAAGPPVRRGHHHLSAATRPRLHAEDRAGEAAVPLERATHLPAPYAREDGRRQTVPVSQKFRTRRLPTQHLVRPATPHIRAILAGQPEGDLDAADRINETAPQPALASVAPLPDSAALLQRIEDLSRQVAALSAERARPRCSSTSRDDAAPTPAGTIALRSPGRESVFSPAPTAGKGN
jgi:hypothetical protein